MARIKSPAWSSSAVDMMNVTVEISTIDRENNAKNWAKLEVHGYSIVFHIHDLGKTINWSTIY